MKKAHFQPWQHLWFLMLASRGQWALVLQIGALHIILLLSTLRKGEACRKTSRNSKRCHFRVHFPVKTIDVFQT